MNNGLIKRNLLTESSDVKNSILRQRSKPVEEIDGYVREVAEFLQYQMTVKHDERQAISFSAVQFGELIRMIIVRVDYYTNVLFINPEIILEKGGTALGEERCLSLPNHSYLVRRPKIVKCRGLNLDGEFHTFKGRDYLARIFKHEVDHLDGILCSDIAERSFD